MPTYYTMEQIKALAAGRLDYMDHVLTTAFPVGLATLQDFVYVWRNVTNDVAAMAAVVASVKAREDLTTTWPLADLAQHAVRYADKAVAFADMQQFDGNTERIKKAAADQALLLIQTSRTSAQVGEIELAATMAAAAAQLLQIVFGADDNRVVNAIIDYVID